MCPATATTHAKHPHAMKSVLCYHGLSRKWLMDVARYHHGCIPTSSNRFSLSDGESTLRAVLSARSCFRAAGLCGSLSQGPTGSSFCRRLSVDSLLPSASLVRSGRLEMSPAVVDVAASAIPKLRRRAEHPCGKAVEQRSRRRLCASCARSVTPAEDVVSGSHLPSNAFTC